MPCRWAGCPTLLPEPGYCLKHQPKAEALAHEREAQTYLVSAVLLYLLCADGEAGAEICAAAATAKQASIVLDNVKAMVRASPALRKRITVFRYHLEHPASNSTLKVLCRWHEATTRWLDLEQFDKCTGTVEPPEGQPCFIGLDLSITHDFSAVAQIFPGDKWIVIPRLYIPRETAQKRWKEHGTPIPAWIKQGHVIECGERTVDYEQIENDILDMAKKNPIIETSYDPYNAGNIVRHLEDAGIITVPIYQKFLQMGAACKEIERRLIDETIIFPPNPALRWMASACEVEEDRHQNIRMVKPRTGKFDGNPKYSVDGLVATVIAAARARLRDADASEAAAEISISFVG